MLYINLVKIHDKFDSYFTTLLAATLSACVAFVCLSLTYKKQASAQDNVYTLYVTTNTTPK
jgi:hypothetical protein